jgi:hypothetical protein
MKPLQEQAQSSYNEALGYIRSLEKGLKRKSRFSNDLRYNIVGLGFEKLFVSLIAFNGFNATHHTPLALFVEASKFGHLPEQMKATAKLVGRFESICSFDGFGYKTPTDDELREMILGLIEIRDFIAKEWITPPGNTEELLKQPALAS